MTFENSFWYKELLETRVKEFPAIYKKETMDVDALLYKDLFNYEEFEKNVVNLVNNYLHGDKKMTKKLIAVIQVLVQERNMLETDIVLVKEKIAFLKKPHRFKYELTTDNVTQNQLLLYRTQHGDFGGWTEEQHANYSKLRNATNDQHWIIKCAEKLDLSIKDIESHIEWENKLIKLQIVQKALLADFQKKKQAPVSVDDFKDTPPLILVDNVHEIEEKKLKKEMILEFKKKKDFDKQLLLQQQQQQILEKKHLIQKQIQEYKLKKQREPQKKAPKPADCDSIGSDINNAMSQSFKINNDRVLLDIQKSATKFKLKKEIMTRESEKERKMKKMTEKVNKTYTYDNKKLYSCTKSQPKLVKRKSGLIEHIQHKKIPIWRQ